MPRGDANRRLTSAQVDEMVRRYTTPLPDGTWEGTVLLAREFGVRPPTVMRWLRNRGITLRSNKEAASGGKRCKPVRNLPPGSRPKPQRKSYPAHLELPGAPSCKCGCGRPVTWNRRKNSWSAYVPGHYRQDAPYKDETWLREQYVTQRQGVPAIAASCGVTVTAVKRYMAQYGIRARDGSEAHRGLMTGELNPAWKGGVAAWPYSSDWKVLARQIRDRDKWTCQDCGEQRTRWGKALHVHHIDGVKLNNDPSNLTALCDRCHRTRHRRERLGPVETMTAA